MKVPRTVRACLIALPLSVTPLMVARAQEPEGKTKERHIPPIAFLPANFAANYVVEQGGLGRLCSTKGAGYFVAPLQLEDGAVIEGISVAIEDRNGDSMGLMSLVRRRPKDVQVLAITSVSEGTGEIEELSTSAITSPVVDNQQSAYLLQVVLTGPKVCLQGATVKYRVP